MTLVTWIDNVSDSDSTEALRTSTGKIMLYGETMDLTAAEIAQHSVHARFQPGTIAVNKAKLPVAVAPSRAKKIYPLI